MSKGIIRCRLDDGTDSSYCNARAIPHISSSCSKASVMGELSHFLQSAGVTAGIGRTVLHAVPSSVTKCIIGLLLLMYITEEFEE